jgi:glycosyltransferase involved in cell wall biosynthesis
VNAVVTPLKIEAALSQRLRAVATLLLEENEGPAFDDHAARDAANMLDTLVRAVMNTPDPARIWLLCAAVSGSLPTRDDVVAGTRFFRLAPPTIQATLWLLDYAIESSKNPRGAHMDLQIVCDGVLVHVDHSARDDLHTGIQQVVRQVYPLWARDHDVVPVVWTQPAEAMRTLRSDELGRLFQIEPDRSPENASFDQPALVVPWHSVVVLAEVPSPDACDRLAALAEFSNNEVVAIGYDCIPALSPEMMPEGETNRFARYLPVIKHARRVASIGSTSTAEFRGFANALCTQALPGPVVSEVALPVGKPTSDRDGEQRPSSRADALPLVLCVGTFEPRKNQMAVVYAAERLWREGMAFELLFIGGSGWGESVPSAINRLQRESRPVRAVLKVSNAELIDAYRRARFTVFPSLHEGFGLPVAESLEHGTPVITSNFGSTEEIARDGGAILIDPYDDEELVSAMRRLLTDDELVHQLRREILARTVRTWEDYASEVWDNIVVPGRDSSDSGEIRRR